MPDHQRLGFDEAARRALEAEQLPARTRMVERAIDAIYPKAGA